MLEFSMVKDLRTGVEALYSLPPEKAIIAFIRQQRLGDWKTWGYPSVDQHPPIPKREAVSPFNCRPCALYEFAEVVATTEY